MGCMRHVLRPGALGRPRGIGWRGMWEGGLGWGIHVTPWLIHVNWWQNPLKCCEVISLQLIKINEKKKKKADFSLGFPVDSDGKESACNAEDMGSIPVLGRSPGGGPANSLQYFCLENLHGQRKLVGYNPWVLRVRHYWATKHHIAQISI